MLLSRVFGGVAGVGHMRELQGSAATETGQEPRSSDGTPLRDQSHSASLDRYVFPSTSSWQSRKIAT